LPCVPFRAAWAKPAMTNGKQYRGGARPLDVATLLADLTARFWSRVEKRGPDDCWTFCGARQPWGPVLSFTGRTTTARRVAWFLLVGPVPAGARIFQRCENDDCVNPAHLSLRPAARLSPESIALIRRAAKRGAKQSDLARRFGVGAATVHRIVHATA